ncbi:MAG: ROK family protein [Oscillospiraceae bacterium]|nr:ROK family protein [Oscillospiraceae bacterium]
MKHYLGIDLGGTNIAAGVVTADGLLIHKASVPTLSERGFQSVVSDIVSLCRQIITDSGVDSASVAAIGVGSSGICDSENGIIIYSSNLQFRDADIRAELQREFTLPVYLANDADCAALGENIAGAAKGSDFSVTITLGTGVGGGIILGKKIISGAYGGGGELGHTVICFDGEPCSCGRKGCWEVYASATALIRLAKTAAISMPQSRLAENFNQITTAKAVFDAADWGDEAAQMVIWKYLEYVACGLTNIANMLQPETIALGGGICAQGDRILTPITEMVAAQIYGGELKTKIVIAELGNDAGIIGAAMLAV